MINAIIMASGHSKRMGTDKLHLPYKGKMIIEHIIDTVIDCPFHQIVLVARDELIIDIGKKKGITVVKNMNSQRGQSESIKLGITHSKQALGYAFFSGDQPLIDKNTIELLIKSFNKYNDYIIVPSYKDLRGTPVVFPKRFKSDLLSLEGDLGGKKIIKQNPHDVIYVEVEKPSQLWDIDTKVDYDKLINGQFS